MAENQVLIRDAERFALIVQNIRSSEHERFNIGTYKEKSVHLALKMFFEPDPSLREVPVGRYIADIRNSTGIHEIQTSGFSSIRRKLEAYLSDDSVGAVELIHPIISRRRVKWVDPISGEVLKDYVSPRRIKEAEIFKELLYLGDSLRSKKLSFTIVSLSCEEIRLMDGIDKTRRRRATRVDTVPVELLNIRRFSTATEMAVLFPYNDGDTFTAEEIRKFLRAPGRNGWAAMKVLEELGIAERIGTEGRRIIYKFHKK